MTRRDDIFSKLSEAFQPDHLEVIDESELHRGHAGYQDGGQSHFRVVIRSQAFAKLSRISRHRAVHTAIGSELMEQVHALALEVTG